MPTELLALELLVLLRPYVEPRMWISRTTPLVVRLASAIDYPGNTTECWTWRGYCAPNGYGCTWLGARSRGVHRVVYELLVGPIPEGLHLDHLCRNRACCNPWHLEPVTTQVNILRGTGYSARNARKTHCVHGHSLLDEANVYHPPSEPHKRKCRECARAAVDRYQLRVGRK